MSFLSPEKWIFEFLHRRQLKDALSKLRQLQPGQQRRTTLLHKNEHGLSCLERLVELRRSDEVLQPIMEACIEENIDFSEVISSRESLGAILRFACTSNVDKTCLKTLFDFSERFVGNDKNAFRQLFLQAPPESPSTFEAFVRPKDRISGEKDSLLVCALLHLFNPKSFRLFWEYFHNRLHCFDQRPDLIHEAKKENMPYNLLELMILSPKPPPCVRSFGMTTDHKDRHHSLESWNLVTDLLATKQVLKEMLLKTSSQSLSDDTAFTNVANVFQDAISCQSTPATTVRALDAAFTKCGLVSVDSSLLVSSSSNIFSESFKPNCLHLALRYTLNSDAFDALVAIIDEHKIMNQLLSDSVRVDWSKLSLPPISSMKWKSSSASASQINILHFAILMQCTRNVLLALAQRLFLQDLFWDMYETPCDFFQRREPCSLSNTTSMIASDSSDEKSVDDYDSDSMSTMMLAALTANGDYSCYKCLCEVMDKNNEVCSYSPRKQRLCLAEGTVAPFNRQPHFLRMNEPVKDSMSPLQNRAFTIPNLQRITKFAAQSVGQCFSLAYINTSFRETMIDFHTSHILFRQLVLSAGEFGVEQLTHWVKSCRVSWVLQEVFLIPEECDVTYEKFMSSLPLSKTLLEKVMHALCDSSTEDRFHFLNFLLSHTRYLQSGLSSGEVLGYIADCCHRQAPITDRELNFIVELFIRAHIDCGAWNYDVLFTKSKKDDKTGHDEDDEEDDENSTSFDNGIRLFFKILCNQRISADLLKYFLDFFPESSARCISNLFDSYSYHPPYDDIEDIDETRTGSCKYPSAFCPLAAFTTAVVVSSVSLEKLEKIIGFLVSRDKLFTVVRHAHSQNQKSTNLSIMIERSSSVEKLEVVLDAFAAHFSSEVLVDELMGSHTDGDSLIFIAFDRRRREEIEKVFRKLLSFIKNEPMMVRDLLIERSFMLCEKAIDHGCPEFLRFILDLYTEHRLLEPALASRLGEQKATAIFLFLKCGYSKNIEVLRLLLKAYAECGLLQHALSSTAKSSMAFRVSYEQETVLRFALHLFTAPSRNEREIAEDRGALDVVRTLIAHFESSEKFQQHHSNEIDKDGKFTTSRSAGKKCHMKEVQDLLTSENCWSECRKWFNGKFGELPPVDKESGRRREREA